MWDFFGFKGWMWDLIVMVPDHCLSFYFACLVLMSKYLIINTLSD